MGTRGRSTPAAERRTEDRSARRGRAERRRTAQRAARKRRRSLLRELPIIAVVALLIALTLKTFFVQVFVIPSGSMEQTIQIGDRVLVDKLTPWFGSTPHRGDVVVFKDPGGWLENERHPDTDGAVTKGVKEVFSYVGLLPSSSEQDLIKRVIGVGGDTVVCCDDRGRITVNGKPIDEPYLAPGNPPSRTPFRVTVPPGRLWVMGDHRDLSADSRYHMTGPDQGTVPLSNVVGRAFLIAWPLGRFQGVTQPSYPTLSAAGQPGQSDVSRPDLLEPSLVMGMLGVWPTVLRRRRRHGSTAGPVDRPARGKTRVGRPG
ncbi:signal peptidase I [Kitasatospora azatica]|uniref:signal peptidase I n=1 Tax=Kitasatospora azatica TaxID=58347 RepID=UPI000689B24E|nr:signal peptidase I [Kitasatospora azatica]